MRAGTASIDITPKMNVWMDGMVRAHPSVGVHDPLFARALVLTNDKDREDAFIIVSVDVCALDVKDTYNVRQTVADKTGISTERIVITTTHTHSGPATFGLFNPKEGKYVGELLVKLVTVIDEAINNMKPAACGCGRGQEDTISHYRRILADDGHVVMNWEPYPIGHIVGPLGKIDPGVGVLKVVDAENPNDVLCLLFNHAGHPNVMSGDNYLLSAEYPGVAERLLESEFGGISIFVNGAQGNVDIDGLRDRDWHGVERAGKALANAVDEITRAIVLSKRVFLRGSAIKYKIPSRKITDSEWTWAEKILMQAGGTMQTLADGVGDDYKALLYKKLREVESCEIPVEQICFSVDQSAFISFPGELFTEIGVRIKDGSPFHHTYILGLANGYIGYIPTRKAIGEGGYDVETRRAGDDAEDIIVEQSLSLLQDVHKL